MKHVQTLTNEQLVADFAAGCNEAFKELLLRHKDKLYGYIFSVTHNRELTEDIFQETFIKAIMVIKQGRYVETGRFFSWLARIAHNLVIDVYRKDVNENTVSNDEYEYDLLNNAKLYDQSAQDAIVYEETLSDLTRLLDFLPATQRTIVVMRFYQNLSFKEIARIQNISINTALGRMRYAVINLRKLAVEKNLMRDLEEIV
ncbi:MAG: sigma-70 family RNA polymerase sigma factor [Prevotellaceae bacterium]|jgi:RNA polymerase sigma-70 factor (ECF subfamily)|nr:sigma-70 family RNA polymerase sigma factor [Prevotellaceae bacterium]